MPAKKIYDKSAEFHAEISPLVKQLHAKCIEHNLPVALVISYGRATNDECLVCHMGGGDPALAPDSIALLTALLNSDFGAFEQAMRVLDKTLSAMAVVLHATQQEVAAPFN